MPQMFDRIFSANVLLPAVFLVRDWSKNGRRTHERSPSGSEGLMDVHWCTSTLSRGSDLPFQAARSTRLRQHA
jgi:hypothetical protein